MLVVCLESSKGTVNLRTLDRIRDGARGLTSIYSAIARSLATIVNAAVSRASTGPSEL